MISFPHEIYVQVLNEIIETNLKTGADNFEISITAGSSKGDNYIGIIYRIEVIDKQTKQSRLNLIAKLPPVNVTRRNELLTNKFFSHEAEFYRNLQPIFENFQHQKGIKDGFYEFPFCYKILTDEPNEGLFFEDLKPSGYEMIHRKQEPTKEHVILVMKVLAKMHAVSFCIKDQSLDLIEKYFDIQDPFMALFEHQKSSMESYTNELKRQTLEVANKSCNKAMIEKIHKLFGERIDKLLNNCIERKFIEPYAVLCHGDITNNNLLFKYDKNGTPTDVRLLDYQIIRFASPICDVVHYIFVCTSKALRDEHYKEFLEVYYEELTGFIRRLGSNPEIIFPRTIFEEHLKKFGHFGLLMAVIVLQLFTSDDDDIQDFDEISEQFKKRNENQNDKMAHEAIKKISKKFEERMAGVCNDMFNLGYI